MSLKDTIQGAREEVANGVAADRQNGDKKDDNSAKGKASGSGFVRKSAARGKPSREAAAGVRVVKSNGKPKSKKNLSREEEKEERKHDREVSDQRYTVSQMYLDNNPTYKGYRKVWWRLIIAAIVLMVVAVGLYSAVGGMEDGVTRERMAIGALVTMVVAYIVVIIALVYDWRKIRPMRKESDQRVASMSEKRLRAVLNRGSVK